MKKRWMVAALLIFAILLSGCGGTAKISPEKSPLDFKSSTLLGSGEETFVCTGLRDGEGAELEAVAIPETYQGLPVTAIGEGAFRGNQNLKNCDSGNDNGH